MSSIQISILWKLSLLLFFINVHEKCKENKSIKFLTCFFTEIIDMSFLEVSPLYLIQWKSHQLVL